MSPRATTMRLSSVLEALGDDVIEVYGVEEHDVQVTSVVLHLADDPAPDPHDLVLWPGAQGPVPSRLLVVRGDQVAALLERVPTGTVVVVLSDSVRWLDAYQCVRSCLRGVVAQQAEYDLFGLADALALEAGGAVAIEDVDRRVLAFSTVQGQEIDEVRRQGILGRRVPEHVEREDWYRRLWKAQGVVEYPAGPQSTPRLALALRVSGDDIGSIWVVGSRASLQPAAHDALRRAADSIATALVQAQRSSSRTREQRSRLVRDLLDSAPGAAGGLQASALVGIDLGPDVDVDDLRRVRLADVLSLQALRMQDSGLAGDVDGRVYAILPVADEPRLTRQLMSILDRSGLETARAAVSNTAAGPGALGAARRDVDALLTMLKGPAQEGFQLAFVSQFRDQILLSEIADAAGPLLTRRSGVAAVIAAHDADHGTQYEDSLRAWLESGGDVSAAAARLHVHANTLRYRNGRAVELFGLRLDDPDARLLLHLELRLRSLLDAPHPP